MQIKGKLLADTFNLVGIKQFDRKVESANKAKNRMKSYQNRGKSAGLNLFNPLKDLQNLHTGSTVFSSFTTKGFGFRNTQESSYSNQNFTQGANL